MPKASPVLQPLDEWVKANVKPPGCRICRIPEVREALTEMLKCMVTHKVIVPKHKIHERLVQTTQQAVGFRTLERHLATCGAKLWAAACGR